MYAAGSMRPHLPAFTSAPALALAFSLALANTGCGASSYQAPSSTSISPYSTSMGSTSASSAPAIPQHGAVKADLVVLPDALVLGFALREVAEDPQQALAAAQAVVNELEIEQRALSLEEIGLSLSVACRLDALPERRGAARE